MRKLLTAAFVFSLLLSAAVCRPGSSESAGAEPEDFRRPAGRVVSLAPSITEIIFAIGAEDKLTGVSRQCDYPVAAKLKSKMGDFNRPDLAIIISARPEAVLFAEYVRANDLKALEEEGIRAVVLPAADMTGLLETIQSIGSITGCMEAAIQLAADMKKEVEEMASRFRKIPVDKRPVVYLEVDGPQELYTVGPGSFMSDVIHLAGGRNAFEGGPAPYFRVSSQEVIEADPEVVLIDHPFQYKVGVSERLGWQKIKAVKNGRIYDKTDFDIILLNRPGPRIVRSLGEIIRILHPEISGVR